MNYQQAVKRLYDLRRFGLKPGLEKTLQLAEQAGNPQERLRFIHVAGTNGKGSTCAMLEAIYRTAGYRVGLYTSPHLISFRERIQVNRNLIDEADVARLVEELGEEQSFTFFEAVTIMALKYFAERQCDVVIWETGLGGRLDATNIVMPLASIITNVQLDHEQWLGRTIPEIAFEKAGIIKPGVPVITAAEEPALEVIKKVAGERGSPVTIVQPLLAYEIGLTGAHQRLNAALAAATAQALGARVTVGEQAIRTGLKTARWAGRLQRIERANGQTILLDGAHNPAGAKALAATLSNEFIGRRPALILGAMADKDCAGICRALAPLAGRICLTSVGSDRSADPGFLANLCREANPGAPVEVCARVAEAVKIVASEPFVVITGSLHFIGEAMECLGLAETASERELNEYTIPKKEIRAVTFDVGGTLIEPWPSVGHVYAEVAARHGMVVSPEALNGQFAAAWKRKRDFAHSRADWARLVDETFAGLIKTALNEAFFGELYDRFAEASAWRVFDDTVPTLQALRRRGIRVAAISNWDERLRPLLRALELDQYFEAIIISSEERQAKPGAAIFRTAQETLGMAPDKILHVGDSRGEDYDGAIAAGFQALWLKRAGEIDDAEQIRRLDEILTRL